MSAFHQIGDALTDAVAAQARTYIARITASGLLGSRGVVSAHSEVLGPIEVFARTTDALRTGDYILVRRSGPEKYSKFIYAGYSGGSLGELPGVSDKVRVYVPTPNDGSETASAAPAGTLAAALDAMAATLRRIQGTATWTDLSPTSLAQVVSWRPPVSTVTVLPSTGNALGDARVTLDTGTLYIWLGTGWTTSTGDAGYVPTIAAQVGATGIGARQPVALLDDGLVVASAAQHTHGMRYIGLTLESAGPYQTALVQYDGLIVFDADRFTWKGPVFLAPGGSLNATPVAGSLFVRKIGTALDARHMIVQTDSVPTLLESALVTSEAASSIWGYAALVGNGIQTAIDVIHNLGTHDVSVELYLSATGATVYANVHRPPGDPNRIVLTFDTPPATASVRVLIRRVI